MFLMLDIGFPLMNEEVSDCSWPIWLARFGSGRTGDVRVKNAQVPLECHIGPYSERYADAIWAFAPRLLVGGRLATDSYEYDCHSDDVGKSRFSPGNRTSGVHIHGGAALRSVPLSRSNDGLFH